VFARPICEQFAFDFDMKFNTHKSIVIRVGEHYHVMSAPLMLDGKDTGILFVHSLKYLTVHLVSNKCFSCCVKECKNEIL